MQSALNVNDVTDTKLVTAEVLRDMTISKEDLFQKQKESVLESLMSSMVRIASESGGKSYSANLNPQFDTTLLVSIVDQLKGLGYAVTVETKTAKDIGNFTQLTISWE
jgi:hypothetical protein